MDQEKFTPGNGQDEKIEVRSLALQMEDEIDHLRGANDLIKENQTELLEEYNQILDEIIKIKEDSLDGKIPLKDYNLHLLYVQKKVGDFIKKVISTNPPSYENK